MIFVIGGVTASGKSDLAFRFAKAIGGIVINFDAYAFYREISIGTAKPTNEELETVPTYLFNNLSVDDRYSIYDFQQDARAIIDKHLKQQVPIVMVGGSGLYIRATLFNYELQESNVPTIEDNPLISNASLYEELIKLDSKAAEKIHVNNRKRILRALAVIKQSGINKSEIDSKTSHTPIYAHTMVVLNRLGEELSERINTRTMQMFKIGLREEVNNVLKTHSAEAQGLQAIGYKEIIQNPDLTDKELIEMISLRTRQYAKRQRTFFRNQFKAEWFTNPDEAYNFLLQKYKEML